VGCGLAGIVAAQYSTARPAPDGVTVCSQKTRKKPSHSCNLLIYMHLFLRKDSAICFNDGLAPFCRHRTQGSPQSYPQKMWVVQTGDTTRVKTPIDTEKSRKAGP
jgi:hypothetical protein